MPFPFDCWEFAREVLAFRSQLDSGRGTLAVRDFLTCIFVDVDDSYMMSRLKLSMSFYTQWQMMIRRVDLLR